jgi:hypothetical protein
MFLFRSSFFSTLGRRRDGLDSHASKNVPRRSEAPVVQDDEIFATLRENGGGWLRRGSGVQKVTIVLVINIAYTEYICRLDTWYR